MMTQWIAGRNHDMGAQSIARCESVRRTNMKSLYHSFPAIMRRAARYKIMIIGILFCGAVAMAPQSADADLIKIRLDGGQGASGSEMYIAHNIGGELGDDSGDIYWFMSGAPPGSPADWLRIYSDQVNDYHSISGFEQRIDNRPADTNLHAIFPLRIDTQGSNPISSTNNTIRFTLESPVDAGREYYHWNITLSNGATFTDGSTHREGVIDWHALGGQGATYEIAGINTANTQGLFGELNVLPSSIPEPSTTLLIIIGGVIVSLRRETRKK